jgi:hypothetical protein
VVEIMRGKGLVGLTELRAGGNGENEEGKHGEKEYGFISLLMCQARQRILSIS